MNERARTLIEGARSMAPILLGVVPFGLVTGAATVGAGIATGHAILMSLLVFAGAAQLASVELFAEHAPILVVLATGLVVNLRFSIYSAALAPHFARLPLRWKGPLAYLLTDQAYAVSVHRLPREERTGLGPWFFLGAAFALWLAWQSSFAIGAVVGARVPASWSLEFAVPVTLLALLPASVGDRSTAATLVVTALVSQVASVLPLQLGILASIGAGIAAGVLTDRLVGSGSGSGAGTVSGAEELPVGTPSA